MLVKCPQCGKKAEYIGNPFRPFCSERCKLIDLGAWVDEEYKIASQEESLSESLKELKIGTEENDTEEEENGR